ncbi:MAG TPA: non-canonical purine NTP pyrophosphatase, partial [Thiolinea sp.]|nr:non-canonical purine NTP pyrophosphatase [Thiolinea sp.]
MSQRLVLASSNAGKLREFNNLLADFGFEVVRQADLGVTDAEETGLSFVENALLKARHASQTTGFAALA